MKKVLLINWDCYPNFPTGGVYTWTKALIESMKDYEFIVVNDISNPNCNSEYTVPPHVTKVIEVPLYGTFRYEEFAKESDPLLPRIISTTESVIKNEFIPLFREFLRNALSDRCDTKLFADLVIKLHKFLIQHDTRKCLEHHLCWDVFIEHLNSEHLYRHLTVKEATLAFQLVQRNITLLSIQMPKVDVIHCSSAWLPSLIAIYAKEESKCPFIITEHGVAYRELLLYYNRYLFDESSKIFWKIFSHNIVRTVYSVADKITTVCNFNKFWEEKLGADTSRIKVVYNGVDISKFRPVEVKRTDNRPTVVSVARIDPFKDIVCLTQAIKYAKEEIPDIQCLIYGGSIDLEYSMRCVKAVKDLQLEDNVKFMGGTKEPEKAYSAGDIVAISSIMEGFPFTVIEAMACGKAVVASDVGGVREALGGCGLLVRSRRPRELAKGIVRLLQDKELRQKYEKASLNKVLTEFTLTKCIEQIKNEYEDLIQFYNNSKQKVGAIAQ